MPRLQTAIHITDIKKHHYLAITSLLETAPYTVWRKVPQPEFNRYDFFFWFS